jgi:phosphoesterase RecJ-like protein
MYNYITENYKDKSVKVYLGEFADSFKILSGSDQIQHEPTNEGHDLAISLDVSSLDRFGDFLDIFNNAISTVCIDHHVSNPGFGDLCFVSAGRSSACETMCDLIDVDKVSLKTAECLYLGIIHDTGVFKYNSTNRLTMEIAGQLLEKGVQADKFIDGTFYKKSYKQNLLLARTILESNLYADGKIISGYVTRETFKDFDCSSIDTDGIVEQLRLTDGVEVAIFAYQLTKKNTKFSLRSKNYVNVNEIAGFFGGGGHEKAAGFETTSSYQRVMKKLIGLIEKQLKD